MKRHQLNNRLRFLAICLGFSILSFNCTEEDNLKDEKSEIVNEVNETKINFISEANLPNTILNVLKSKADYNSSNNVSSRLLNNNIIDVDNIMQVIDTIGNTNYTFRLNVNNDDDYTFFNLVIKESTESEESISYVLKYEVGEGYFETWKENNYDFSFFTGKVYRYNLSNFLNLYFDTSNTSIANRVNGADDCPCGINDISNGTSGNPSDGGGSSGGGSESEGNLTLVTVCHTKYLTQQVLTECTNGDKYAHWPEPYISGGYCSGNLASVASTHCFSYYATSNRIGEDDCLNPCDDEPDEGEVGVLLPKKTALSAITIANLLGFQIGSPEYELLDSNSNLGLRNKITIYLNNNKNYEGEYADEAKDISTELIGSVIENRITINEALLTLSTLSNDVPWTLYTGTYNGVSSLSYTHTRSIISNGRPHTQFRLTNGDVLSSSSYPQQSGSSELVPVLFYFNQSTKLWYDFQEPTSYSPLTLDFLWDGFWSSTATAVRIFTPLEDIIILIDGKDFDGVEQSRAVAATWILVDIIPGTQAIKVIKMVKYGDEAIQIAEAVIKYADDIYKTQKDLIKNVLNGIENLTNNTRKANFGEIIVDVDLYEKGYTFINRTDGVIDLADTAVHTNGIDHIIKNDAGEYILVETKYNTATLSNTNNGLQMSETWITNHLNNLSDELGDIGQDILLDGYTSVLAEIATDGSIVYFTLNNLGQKIGPWMP